MMNTVKFRFLTILFFSSLCTAHQYAQAQPPGESFGAPLKKPQQSWFKRPKVIGGLIASAIVAYFGLPYLRKSKKTHEDPNKPNEINLAEELAFYFTRKFEKSCGLFPELKKADAVDKAVFKNALNAITQNQTRENAYALIALLHEDSKALLQKYAQTRIKMLEEIKKLEADYPFLVEKRTWRPDLEIWMNSNLAEYLNNCKLPLEKQKILDTMKEEDLLGVVEKARRYGMEIELVENLPFGFYDYPSDIFSNMVVYKAFENEDPNQGTYKNILDKKLSIEKLNEHKDRLEDTLKEYRESLEKKFLECFGQKELEAVLKDLRALNDQVKDRQSLVKKIEGSEKELISFLEKCEEDDGYKASNKENYYLCWRYPHNYSSELVLEEAIRAGIIQKEYSWQVEKDDIEKHEQELEALYEKHEAVFKERFYDNLLRADASKLTDLADLLETIKNPR